MTETSEVETAFLTRDAYDAAGEGFVLATTAFEGRVTFATGSDESIPFDVRVQVPTLGSATLDTVPDVVVTDWYETFVRRLEAAPDATRRSLGDVTLDVDRQDGQVTISYAFETHDPEVAVDVAKTLIEYVEGTYVEGIVPGYEYTSPVADLLATASQTGDSGTPL